MRKDFRVIAPPTFFTAGLLVLGILSFGIWTTFIFAFGFFGGLLLWLLLPSTVPFREIKAPYWITLLLFIFGHRVEENLYGFQEELAKITGRPVPELTSPALILLVLATVGGWFLIPYLVKREHPFGYYLAWSFFASMGITELAHFVLPFFRPQPYGYFPGMASVLLLAPSAWWGMRRLVTGDQADSRT